MSRRIPAVNHSDLRKEAASEWEAKDGRLLFTAFRGKDCAILLRDGRAIAIRPLSARRNRIGAVYVGKIKSIVRNIDACFVEISDGEICFLPLSDARFPLVCGRAFDPNRDTLREGDELLVQISREAQKTKQPRLTAHISLSNEAAAVCLGAPHIGYSGKLSPEEKKRLSGWVERLRQEGRLSPVDLVVRTRAGECGEEEFAARVTSLLTELRTLCETAPHRTCFSCVREAEPSFASVLDKLAYPWEYEEIVTDDGELYPLLREYCARKLPSKGVRLYEDAAFPLSKLYSLDARCGDAFRRVVWLKSGAYLVIEPTEALTVIDVNSGKCEAGKGMSDSFYAINCEAAREVARQLRLRNLSGMILVDFINMPRKEDPERLLTLLRGLAKQDRQKVTVVDMTPLGLVEITRKKDEPPLAEQFADREGADWE